MLVRFPILRRIFLTPQSRRLFSEYRKDLFNEINFQKGVLNQDSLKQTGVTRGPSVALKAVTDNDIFSDKENFIEFLKTVNNNAILIDFVIKYEIFLDLDVAFIIFEKMKENLVNISIYKNAAQQEYDRLKRNKQLVGFNVKNLTFLVHKYLVEDLDYLYLQKLVQKVLKSSDQEYHKVVILYQVLLDFDPGFLDAEVNRIVIEPLDPQNPNHEEYVLQTKSPNILYYWLHSLIYQLNELTDFTNESYVSASSKVEKLISQNLNKLSDRTVLLSMLISDKNAKKIPNYKSLILKSSEKRILTGVKELDLRQKIELSCILLRKKDRSLFNVVLSYASVELNGLNKRTTLGSFKQLYDLFIASKLPTFHEAVLKNFTLIDFLKEDYSKIFIARFYLSKLKEKKLINDVNLSFIADYLDSLSQEDYDLENFAYLYYNLTIMGFYSDNFAIKYTENILSAFKGKTLLASASESSVNKEGDIRIEDILIRLVWAYLTNQKRHLETKAFSSLVEPSKQIINELSQRSSNYQTSDSASVEMISQIKLLAAKLFEVYPILNVYIENKPKAKGFEALILHILSKAENVDKTMLATGRRFALVNKRLVRIDMIDEHYFYFKLDKANKLSLFENQLLAQKTELDKSSGVERLQIRLSDMLIGSKTLSDFVNDTVILAVPSKALTSKSLFNKFESLKEQYQDVKIKAEASENNFRIREEADEDYVLSSDSDYK